MEMSFIPVLKVDREGHTAFKEESCRNLEKAKI